MGDFFAYVVDADLYLGLIWLVSYLWINQHIWYPKVSVCQINNFNTISDFTITESSPGHF